MFFNTKKFVSLDIETTGFSPEKGGRIIEIGGVKVENGKVIDTYEALVYPEQSIPKKITELTGITNDMVMNAPVIGKVLPEFYEFLEGCDIVAHNARFDWNTFLLPAFQKIGKVAKHRVLDTMKIYKETKPDVKKYGLAFMCNAFNITLKSHHRAIDDCEATAMCLLHMQKHYPELFTIEDEIFTDGNVAEEAIEAVQVIDANKWDKKIGKKHFKRWYVKIKNSKGYGTVFFDINHNAWYNKDCQFDIDFSQIERDVIKLLNLQSKEELFV